MCFIDFTNVIIDDKVVLVNIWIGIIHCMTTLLDVGQCFNIKFFLFTLKDVYIEITSNTPVII